MFVSTKKSIYIKHADGSLTHQEVIILDKSHMFKTTTLVHAQGHLHAESPLINHIW